MQTKFSEKLEPFHITGWIGSISAMENTPICSPSSSALSWCINYLQRHDNFRAQPLRLASMTWLEWWGHQNGCLYWVLCKPSAFCMTTVVCNHYPSIINMRIELRPLCNQMYNAPLMMLSVVIASIMYTLCCVLAIFPRCHFLLCSGSPVHLQCIRSSSSSRLILALIFREVIYRFPSAIVIV